MIEPETTKRYDRELRAMVKAAGDDPEAFAVVASLIDVARARMRDAARTLTAQGYSWAEIGRALGVTRQAAQQRYDHRD